MLVIAHRGYSGKYPENTLRAFEEALSLKAAAIELDVHLSKDNELVVTHDFVLGRCLKAPHANASLSDFSAAELGQMDAGSFKASSFASERVSTLSTVLDLVNHRCLLNIEVKKETLLTENAYETMSSRLFTCLKSYGLKDVLFSSFDPHMLATLRRNSLDARLAYLDDRADQGPRLTEAKALGAEAYNVNLKRSSFEIIQLIKSAQLKAYAYTVKTPSDLALAQGLQVDGIFADNLEEALNYF